MEDIYWDRCAAGEDPEAVVADVPEMERTHRNVSAQAAALVKALAERDEIREALRQLLGCHEYLSETTGHRADGCLRYQRAKALLVQARQSAQERPCPTCDGCGQVADTDGQEPWTAWTNLPPGSDAAVRIGLVKPIPCPACSELGR